MDSTEKLATLDTPDTGQINVRENRRGNQKWIIQRNGQHGVHKTKGQSKIDNPRRRKTKQKHHYAKANTNTVILMIL